MGKSKTKIFADSLRELMVGEDFYICNVNGNTIIVSHNKDDKDDKDDVEHLFNFYRKEIKIRLISINYPHNPSRSGMYVSIFHPSLNQNQHRCQLDASKVVNKIKDIYKSQENRALKNQINNEILSELQSYIQKFDTKISGSVLIVQTTKEDLSHKISIDKSIIKISSCIGYQALRPTPGEIVSEISLNTSSLKDDFIHALNNHHKAQLIIKKMKKIIVSNVDNICKYEDILCR